MLAAGGLAGSIGGRAEAAPLPGPKVFAFPLEPLATDGSRPRGMAIDLVEEVYRRAGFTASIEMAPVSRIVGALDAGAQAVAAYLSRTRDRELKCRWIDIVYADAFVFVGRAGTPIGSLAHARSARIAVRANSALSLALDEEGFTAYDTNADDAANLQLLLHGRVDAWLTSSVSLDYLLRRAGCRREEISVGFRLRENALWMAAGLSVPASTVAQLQLAFDAARNDGVVSRLLATYGLSETG